LGDVVRRARFRTRRAGRRGRARRRGRRFGGRGGGWHITRAGGSLARPVEHAKHPRGAENNSSHERQADGERTTHEANLTIAIYPSTRSWPGSSISSLTRTRKRTASAPSTIRWS